MTIPGLADVWSSLQPQSPALALLAVMVVALIWLVAIALPIVLLVRSLWPLPATRGIQDSTAGMPLHRRLEAVNLAIGRVACWLALPMVLIQFVVVVMRYVFSIGSIPLQESIVMLHALLFMLGIGYTLARDEHVRIDIWYREAAPRRRAWVDLAGSVVFLIPLCLAVLWLSWDYVAKSWAVREGSVDTGGLPYVYLLKTTIPLLAVLLFIQALAVAARSLLALTSFGGDAAGDGREQP